MTEDPSSTAPAAPPLTEPTLPAGPSFGLTFLYYFCGTALVTTLLAVKSLGIGLDTGIPNQYGIGFGMIGGLLGALVNRSTTLTLPISSQKTFKRELDTALADMGYTEVEDPNWLDGISVYRRPFVRQLLSGRIYVLITDKKAQISSRKLHMGGIKKRLEASGIR
ncbi:MAG: hypothetical protein EA368_00925 [Leptolyngbya sp. DLM2.Bin27]|nr:MAG: hypothetical protein EA368_00925 [Leptolyngbya sp. DLM2.Bin27]